jgi:signal transduction histidine kinase
MRTPELFRSIAFRLALAFALAITAATAAVFALVYLEISTTDVARLRVVLADEAAKGVSESDSELRRALDLRLTRDLRRLDYVALYNPDGSLVFGNVAKMPPIEIDGAAHFVAAEHPPGVEDRTEPALFVARRRPDGGVLLLGRSLLEVYAIRSTVLWSLLTGLAPTILLALAIGAFFARRASQRLTRIHDTIGRIMAGDLDARLPVGDNPGDIDRVARAVNLMLDEIVRLLDRLKVVGDNIAHDLRAPLAVVRAKLERGLTEDSDERALRAAAAEALARLDKTMIAISALLRVSAIESGLRLSAFREIDVAEISADLFEFYEPLARANGVEMILDAPASAHMAGDADLMREAISNLIDNAIKYTSPGGKVRLEVVKRDGLPVVRVTDNGCGVAPADREKIFKRFYRGESGQDAEGHGLGLSIAGMIAGLHGVDLTVTDNAPGACFELAPRPKSAAAMDQARLLMKEGRPH